MTRTARSWKYGFLGALACLSGSALAIFFVPENYSSAGALIGSAGIMTTALLLVPLIRFKADYCVAFRAEHVMMFGLVYWILLDVLQSAYDLPVTREAVVDVFLGIGLAAAGMWLGANVGRWRVPEFLRRQGAATWTPEALFAAVVLAFVLGVWDFLYRSDFNLQLIFHSLVSESRFETPWQRGRFGDWGAFSYHLQYFGYIVPALVVMYASKRGWFDWRTILGLLLSSIILLFHVQGGGRRIVAGIIAIAWLCWLLPKRKMTSGNVLPSVGLVVGLLVALQLMLLVRGAGLRYGIEESVDYVHVDDNFKRLAQTMELVPEYIPFVDLQFILWVLMRPIPRALWPDKPESGGFDLATILNPTDIETTLSITMIGELYVSWGFTLVFIGGWFFGRLASMVNAFLEDDRLLRNPLIVSIGLVLLLIGIRSLIELFLMSYPLIAWMIISLLLGMWYRVRTIARPAT